MAGKKGNRQIFNFECSVCKNKNYVVSRNTVLNKEKMTAKKYCKKCRKSTPHTEVKIK